MRWGLLIPPLCLTMVACRPSSGGLTPTAFAPEPEPLTAIPTILATATVKPARTHIPALAPTTAQAYSVTGAATPTLSGVRISDEILDTAAYIAAIEPQQLTEFVNSLRDAIVAVDAEALASVTILPVGSCEGVERPIDTTEELEAIYREVLDDDFRAQFSNLSLNEGNTIITWYGVGIPGEVWFTNATGQLGIRILRFDGYCVLTERPQAVGDTPSP